MSSELIAAVASLAPQPVQKPSPTVLGRPHFGHAEEPPVPEATTPLCSGIMEPEGNDD
jgi:hypothetical protein